MHVIRSLEEFEEADDRSLTVAEIKDAIAHAQASLEEYSRLGELEQAQAAYNDRENLLLSLAALLPKDEAVS